MGRIPRPLFNERNTASDLRQLYVSRPQDSPDLLPSDCCAVSMPAALRVTRCCALDSRGSARNSCRPSGSYFHLLTAPETVDRQTNRLVKATARLQFDRMWNAF